MNPTTDRVTHVALPDGRTIEVIQPGALTKPSGSSNWRLTREVFERYRAHLTSMTSNWPRETSYAVPDGMSPNTFCRCLRDARQALLQNKYDPDLYSAHLALIREAVIGLDPSGTAVWFRARGQKGRERRVGHTVISNQHRSAPTRAIFATPSADELRAMCTLIKSGHLESPVQFRGRIDEDLITTLESTHDVAFVWDEVTDVTTLA